MPRYSGPLPLGLMCPWSPTVTADPVTERARLLAADADPDNHTIKLAFADFLDEQAGRVTARSAFIRALEAR